MALISTGRIKDVKFGSVSPKAVYYGNTLIWAPDQGAAINYPGTGWYKALDTGIVFCKGIPSGQTHSFTGDPKVYISVHNTPDARKYADRAATSNLTMMQSMFSNMTFNADISHWDVSNVTHMEYMFANATLFNQDISNWDVSKVVRMSGMFSDAESFNQDLSKWDVSSVTLMIFMFSGATKFNQNLSNWNVSNVTATAQMFRDAKAFNGNISNWNVSNVLNMENMFRDATVFNQNLSKWCVTKIKSKPTGFDSGSALTAANLPKWGTCPPR